MNMDGDEPIYVSDGSSYVSIFIINQKGLIEKTIVEENGKFSYLINYDYAKLDNQQNWTVREQVSKGNMISYNGTKIVVNRKIIYKD